MLLADLPVEASATCIQLGSRTNNMHMALGGLGSDTRECVPSRVADAQRA